jgi:hypothetical protein
MFLATLSTLQNPAGSHDRKLPPTDDHVPGYKPILTIPMYYNPTVLTFMHFQNQSTNSKKTVIRSSRLMTAFHGRWPCHPRLHYDFKNRPLAKANALNTSLCCQHCRGHVHLAKTQGRTAFLFQIFPMASGPNQTVLVPAGIHNFSKNLAAISKF